MKIKQILLLGGAALLCNYVTYRAGELVGHCRCLDNVLDKYGEHIFEKEDRIVDRVWKHFSIVLFKPDKKGETAKGE